MQASLKREGRRLASGLNFRAGTWGTMGLKDRNSYRGVADAGKKGGETGRRRKLGLCTPVRSRGNPGPWLIGGEDQRQLKLG